MLYKDLLLSDESSLSNKDYIERKKLIEEFSKMPVEFFSKLRHFQPQIGCLNACKICSKFAGTTTEYWTESRQRNVIAALKYSVPKRKDDLPLIVWDRNEHRTGVIFSYLDNDIGNYFYLDKFIELAYRELGVVTRISTVGYSRLNDVLNKMHQRINSDELLEALGGVRLSFTPYEIGWECPNNTQKYSQYDYISDMANFLKTYKPYYKKAGAGSRNMCVEIRYKPLVEISQVFDTTVLSHKVICTANYLFISKNTSVVLRESRIADPYDHSIKLTEESEVFYQIDLYDSVNSLEETKKLAHKFIISDMENYPVANVYLMKNAEGIYYAINPNMTEKGNYGINIYPITKERLHSGYIITERFLVNSMIAYKAQKNLGSLEKFNNATWDDVYAVLEMCKTTAKMYYEIGKKEKSTYIINEIMPMINAYVSALQVAEFEASDFFNPDFTIDTGIICNLGRAVSLFKGITTKENEPLTPVHERNYGKFNSKMSMEGTAWRLSCDYNDSIVIEQLNLFNTTESEGQVAYKKSIQLDKDDEILKQSDLLTQYLIPGQRR